MKNYLFLIGIILLNLKISLAQITRQPRCNTDGEFIPHPENCQWFIQCTSVGMGQRGECPEGELFNPVDRVCDPEDQVDCDAGLGWNGVCEQRHTGLFFPHPLSCEMWILCDGVDQPVEGWCDFGEYFDPITTFCDLAENVDCRIGNPTTPPPTTRTTRPPGGAPTRPGGGAPTRPAPRTTTRSPGKFICEQRHVGLFLPHPTNCEMWIFCQGINQPIEGWCGAGMHFNPAERACDLAQNVDCRIGNPTTRKPVTRPGGGAPTRPGGGPSTRKPVTRPGGGAPTRPGGGPSTRKPVTRPGGGAPTRPGGGPPTRPGQGPPTRPSAPARPV